MKTLPSRYVVLLGPLLVSHRVAAQAAESSDAHLQTLCQAALRRAAEPDSLMSALGSLQFCGVSGPPVVAAAWSGFDGDDRALGSLVHYSALFRDNRIMAAVREVARSESAPRRMRLASLRVMVSYFQAGAWVFQGQLDSAVTGSTMGIWDETHFTSTVTSDPLRATAPMEIGVTLAQLAAGSSDTVVKSAARLLRRELYYRRQDATPLLPGAIALFYRCGNRFFVRNTGDISPRMTYVVSGFAESKTFSAAAPDSGATYHDTDFATTKSGTVELWFNGHLLQTAENPGTGCN